MNESKPIRHLTAVERKQLGLEIAPKALVDIVLLFEAALSPAKRKTATVADLRKWLGK